MPMFKRQLHRKSFHSLPMAIALVHRFLSRALTELYRAIGLHTYAVLIA